MEVTLGSSTVYLDELCLHNVLEHLDEQSALSRTVAVSKSFSAASVELASDRLLKMLKRQQVLPLRYSQGGRSSRITQLGTWAAIEAHEVLTLRADRAALTFATDPPPHRGWPFGPADGATGLRVSRMADVSNHGHHAIALSPERCPTFVPDCLGPGIGALEFTGSSILQTAPFATPLPQPVSLMVVARCRGDTTMCDSLTATSARFELCHGYPTASGGQPTSPAICISANGVGNDAPAQLMRGSTRSTNEWHVYTAIYNGSQSAMFVDGVREASGKNVGSSALDGLRIGCDHTSTFFLKGAVAELRVYSCHLDDGPRAQMEAALALRYGLSPAPFAEQPIKRSRSRSRSGSR